MFFSRFVHHKICLTSEVELVKEIHGSRGNSLMCLPIVLIIEEGKRRYGSFLLLTNLYCIFYSTVQCAVPVEPVSKRQPSF
jgi:hypothetical protein